MAERTPGDKGRIERFFAELHAVIEEDKMRVRRHRKHITVAETCGRLLDVLNDPSGGEG